MKRHHDLTTPNGRLRGDRGSQCLNGVGLLEHTALRIARIVDLRNIPDHLIHQGTLVGIVSHVGLELEPFTTGGLHGNPVDHNGGPLDRVVSDVLNPLELKTRIVRRRSGVRILHRRPNVRQIEDKVAVVKKICDTTNLATERRGGSCQRELKCGVVKIQSNRFHRKVRVTLLHRSKERHRGVSVEELILSPRCHQLQ